jgi:hypothetical protein
VIVVTVILGLVILVLALSGLVKNIVEYRINEMLEEAYMPDEDDESITVAIVDDKAYWVSDNTFLTADVVDGTVDHDTVHPIDAFSIPFKEVTKMLFILDRIEKEK